MNFRFQQKTNSDKFYNVNNNTTTTTNNYNNKIIYKQKRVSACYYFGMLSFKRSSLNQRADPV